MRRSLLSSLSLLALCAPAPESSGGAAPAAPNPGKTKIHVASRLDGGHRRAGLSIPALATELEVTAEQLERLKADPNVVLAGTATTDAVEAGEPARAMLQRQQDQAAARATESALSKAQARVAELEAEKAQLEQRLAEATKPAPRAGKSDQK